MASGVKREREEDDENDDDSHKCQRNTFTEFVLSQIGGINAVCCKGGNTLLHKAVREENFFMISKLLTYRNINVNKLNDEGLSPLHVAVKHGLCEVVGKLLTLDAVDINLHSEHYDKDYFETPLILAIGKEYPEIVKLLLADKRIDVDEPAVRLDSYIEDVHFEDEPDHECYRPPVHLTPFYYAAETGNEDIVCMLVDCNAYCNGNSCYWYSGDIHSTPLHVAAECGFEGVVQLLLDRDVVNVNAFYEYDEYTPLHLAIQSGEVGVVKILLSHKDINVNFHDSMSLRQPLSEAVYEDSTPILNLLLDHKNIQVEAAHIEYALKHEKYNALHSLFEKDYPSKQELLMKSVFNILKKRNN